MSRAQLSTNPAALAAAAATSNSNQNISNQQISQSNTQTNINGNLNSNTSSSSSNNNNNSVVGLHYKIGKKIGEGSFGVIFEGTNIINGVAVAIKFEPRKTDAPQLRDEYRTYKHLHGCEGIANAYYFGQEGLHNILVIDLLGPSLEDLFDWCGRRFSIKTVVQIAIQMIDLIETVHKHDLIYRDIKPDNFLIGRQGLIDENKVHLVDFGMAKQYRDPRTKNHIPYREKKSLSGTARYMSINTHLGREQSRRDDLEALGHVFFYFLRGQLPWQGLKAPNNKQKYEKIGDKKRTTPAITLCDGLPRQFAEYLDNVRSLNFDEEPAYEEYRMSLLSVLDDLGQTADGDYDWLHLNNGKGWDASINKKPNLHGYGHPNPPNERERRHRDPRRNRHHQQPTNQPSNQQHLQNNNNLSNQPVNNNSNNSNSNLNQFNNGRELTAAQLHQQKLQHLVNRPLPPIKQEINQSNQNLSKYEQRQNQYDQQKDEEKGFWSKFCCQ
ncbi:casein kinase I homolog 1 [[Candida] jaroonii]|uniref:Casein kinase I homolog 1 n=1 Tax=[Candida] jaroonii TaxID=467808 RepID=A0ACA9Y8B4_9ASCO|nr:casein kinase I homolog 1 [[Candida] jaroonii]